MERRYSYIELIVGLSLLASFCLILFLCGFYLGFGELHDLNRVLQEADGIRLGDGGNPYRGRSLGYAVIAVLLLVSLILQISSRRTWRIIGASILFISILPAWNLFILTPSVLSVSRLAPRGPDLNFVLYLDLTALAMVGLGSCLSVLRGLYILTRTKEPEL